MLLWSISPTFLVREAPCHQVHHLDASCKQSWKTALQLDGHMEKASEAVWPLSEVLVAESDTLLLLLPHSYWPVPGLLIFLLSCHLQQTLQHGLPVIPTCSH